MTNSLRQLIVVLTTVVVIHGCVDSISLEEKAWYGVSLQGKPVGYFSQQTYRHIPLKKILVVESLTIKTKSGMPYVQSKTYSFNADPPQSLLSAGKKSMRFEQGGISNYEFDPSDQKTGSSFLYTDLLRGTDENLVPNSLHTYKHLGRDMSDIVETEWTVRTERDALTQVTEPLDNTLIVDENGRIQRLITGGIEYVLIENQIAQQSWKDSIEAPFQTSLEVPVIGDIPDPRNVALLKLKFESRGSKRSEWNAYLDGERVFDSSTFNKNRPTDDVDSRFPLARDGVLDEQLKRLADQMPKLESPLKRVHAMVTLVNEYLDYQELDYSPNLAEILRTRQGDCTEFAKLYQALSDYIGLNSNIVYGLVYESSSHSFRPHAWNEVEIDGSWVGVDPTFNQTVLDATHIPFPNAHHAALINDLFQTEFHVLEVRNRG